MGLEALKRIARENPAVLIRQQPYIDLLPSVA